MRLKADIAVGTQQRDELASAEPDPDQRYFFACDVAMYDGSSFTGDLFSSTIEPAAAGSDSSSA